MSSRQRSLRIFASFPFALFASTPEDGSAFRVKTATAPPSSQRAKRTVSPRRTVRVVQETAFASAGVRAGSSA